MESEVRRQTPQHSRAVMTTRHPVEELDEYGIWSMNAVRTTDLSKKSSSCKSSSSSLTACTFLPAPCREISQTQQTGAPHVEIAGFPLSSTLAPVIVGFVSCLKSTLCETRLEMCELIRSLDSRGQSLCCWRPDFFGYTSSRGNKRRMWF